ncbi:putative DNA-binding transcriptional regulator YafY [Aneurinibacillus soli]|uniref:HTH domain protein n=1 Tax=Aneurinibacillus soli TaxID=1500254 RepID=A0A0U4NIZ8_9BACL|nr:YafY family protein [Aneurinibacillus soli]PYE62072.1 putative DNA-binding transcriptional regulator YafY [Aneurinibacillus soli]BAU28740.1 HTH domain protein [Aneurinibacillus soli]
MNKTDRMLAIVLELQRSGTRRAEDLAAIFETSIRTIYRDVQALSEAGVPIVGAPGQGYSLVDGYFLPPVSFTAEEAVTLLLGIDFVEQQFDVNYRVKARASRGKIESILPDSVQRETVRMRASLKLLAGTTADSEQAEEALGLLRRAVLEERKVHFHYMKKIPEPTGNRQSSRTVEPYGLVYVGGTWTLIAFCNLRQELRHFRLRRMCELTLLDETFKRPPDFNLQTYEPPDDRNILVHILMNRDLLDKVKEYNYFYTEALEDTPEGLLVVLRVRQFEEVLPWVLSWGADAKVLGPASLRKRVQEEIAKMIKHY